MLADTKGRIIYRANNTIDREMAKLAPILEQVLGQTGQNKAVMRDGLPYMPASLKRNGEDRKTKRYDRFPSISCATDGRAYLAITSNRKGNSDVFVRVFDGKKWSQDWPVATSAADEYDPHVLVDRNNRLWLTWTSNADRKNYNIFVATVDDLGAPIQPMQLTHAEDDAMHARMACDSTGNIWVSYYKWHKWQGNSRDKEVYVRRHDGKKWSREIQVSPTDVPWYEDHSDPIIAAYDDGVVVAWSWDFHRPKGYTGRAGGPTVYLRTLAADLSLGKPIAVSQSRIDTAPDVAVDLRGNIWCAWDSLGKSSFGGLGKTVYVRQCKPKPEKFYSDPKPITDSQANVCTPQLVASPQGTITLIWCEKAAVSGLWLLKRADWHPNTARWSKAQIVEDQRNPRFPCAAYDSAGNLWIAYSRETQFGWEVTAKRIPAQ